jgi:hypothetical protein
VGQNTREEIDVQPAGSSGGENYGWRLREGTIATPSGGVGGDRPPGAIDPIYDYTRGAGPFQGASVTGGYVYRGPIAEIQGHYFFGDYVSEALWSLVWDGSDPSGFDGTNFSDLTDRTAELTPPMGSINQISSFAEDAAGNLYILDLGGEIFRITSTAPATTSTTSTSILPSTSTTTTTTTTVPFVMLFPPARKLVIKRRKSGGQRLRIVAKDARVAAAGPCATEGELVIEAVGAVRRFPLVPELWTPLARRRPGRGCRYRRGPVVSTLRLKTGRALVVKAKTDDLAVPLGTDPRPVRIEIRHGDIRHCLEFGGVGGRYVPGRKLIAKHAEPAAVCPASSAVSERRVSATR